MSDSEPLMMASSSPGMISKHETGTDIMMQNMDGEVLCILIWTLHITWNPASDHLTIYMYIHMIYMYIHSIYTCLS